MSVPTQADMVWWRTRPGVIVQTATSMTTTSGDHPYVTWDGTDVFQSKDTTHSAASTRIVMNCVGWHKVRWEGVFAANATGIRWSQLSLNAGGVYTGGTVIATVSIPALNGASTTLGCTTFVNCTTPGDYVQLFVYQDSGGNLVYAGSPMTMSCFYHGNP